jgi:preprotein translocase subunit YajC
MNYFMLLTGSTEAGGSAGASLITLVGYMALIGVVFYFLLFRPQRKQKKQTQAMLSTVAIGDSVLTTAGMYGVVIDVMDEVVIVEFGNNKNCRIPMKKAAIVEVEKSEKPAVEKKV